MHQLLQRGVPRVEHPDERLLLAGPDWESIRLFIEVARSGSFRAAAPRVACSVNGLRRRIEQLEHKLKITLLTKHVDGIRLTEEGERVYAAAQRMEDAAFGIVRARDRTDTSLSGEIRIAVTEGLGAFWLAPRLVEFQRAYPGLTVELNCAMRSADVMRLEADVAVQLTKPTLPDLKIVKLGRLHIMPFAGRAYVETFGIPKTKEEIFRHRIVLQASDQTEFKTLYKIWFNDVPQKGFVALRTNTSSANYWSTAKGAGIGWLPTYAFAIGARIIPVDIDLRASLDIWLTYHNDVSRIPRVRRVIDWLIASFRPSQYPWFRDEFLHPTELSRLYHGVPMPQLFEGFQHRESV